MFCKLINIEVNCEWSSWNVGSCTQTCGGGALTKTRSKAVEEANGGTCHGQPFETEICNPQNCPGTLFCYIEIKPEINEFFDRTCEIF